MYISLIIPSFNEETVITETHNRLIEVFKLNSLSDYELIFINDGSSDNTYEILKALSLKDMHIKVLSFSRNFGHQAAVTAGLRECKGDVAIIVDADLQDPPELIPEMIKIYKTEKCNVVYGVREAREGESFFKKMSAKLFYRSLNYLGDVSFPLDTGDFRLIDRKVIDVFNNLPERNKYIRGLISWLGFIQCPIYYKRDPRFSGETKYSLGKMFKLASIGLFYFSKKPLMLATSIGFMSILIGLIYALWLIINVIFQFGHIVSGWTSIILIIIFFGGVQLLTIGILGQYVGSLFDEVKRRPEYIISDKINF